MAKILVLGAGMMGSALCVPLADRGHEVRLIGTPLDAAIVSSVAHSRVHPTLGVELPPSVRCEPVAQLEKLAEDAEAIVLGVSSAGVGWAADALSPVLARRNLPVLMVSKGLQYQSGELHVLTEAFRLALPAELRAVCQPVSICGPCIAGELARRAPTMVVFTGQQLEHARRFADWLQTAYYRIVLHADVFGVQICAALKNAYAMGIAFGAGLHQRAQGERGSVAMHNYEAAVFAQALVEMQELVVALGGAGSTVIGLPGSGDLTVTCNGGRTGRFGTLLGLGHGTRDAIRLMQGATLECLEVLAELERFSQGNSWGSGARYPERRKLPLLRHLMDVGLHGAAVDVPFQDFFPA